VSALPLGTRSAARSLPSTERRGSRRRAFGRLGRKGRRRVADEQLSDRVGILYLVSVTWKPWVRAFGATARGAVTALNALGVNDVDVLTHREVAAVAAPIHSTRIVHFDTDDTAA
jgi:hypothetical protein